MLFFFISPLDLPFFRYFIRPFVKYRCEIVKDMQGMSNQGRQYLRGSSFLYIFVLFLIIIVMNTLFLGSVGLLDLIFFSFVVIILFSVLICFIIKWIFLNKR